MGTGRLESASLLENLQFNETVIVANALQGLFRRRRTAVGLATRLDVDGRAVRLLGGMRRGHGQGPLWVRVMNTPALLLLSVEDVRRVLEGSPHPFAPDPAAKRKGMGHFQPDALTLSRGDLWANRRRFTEAVLESEAAAHSMARTFLGVVDEELAVLVAELVGAGEPLDYERLHAALSRIVRRVVLGEDAAEDTGLSDLLGELMGEANALPSERSARYGSYVKRLGEHVARAAPESLVGRFAQAPADADTRAGGQVTHWLFAMSDTLAANVLRAVGLIAAHDVARARVAAEVAVAGDLVDSRGVLEMSYVRACLEEAMRLYPTTPLLSRETLVELSWNGRVVPAGTQILIVNAFHHRDSERLAYADRFAPEEWIDGEAAGYWGFNHLSHGPEVCPGANLSLLLGSAVVGQLFRRASPRVATPRIDPSRPLPHMLDIFGLRVDL